MQTILVVEPTQGMCETVTASIDPNQVQIVWAFDETMARDFLGKHGVSAIVVNVDAHPSEDLGLIKLVRKQRRHHQAHIIALSDRTDCDSLRRALRAGADDYMSQPVLPSELRGRFAWAATGANR